MLLAVNERIRKLVVVQLMKMLGVSQTFINKIEPTASVASKPKNVQARRGTDPATLS